MNDYCSRNPNSSCSQMNNLFQAPISKPNFHGLSDGSMLPKPGRAWTLKDQRGPTANQAGRNTACQRRYLQIIIGFIVYCISDYSYLKSYNTIKDLHSIHHASTKMPSQSKDRFNKAARTRCWTANRQILTTNSTICAKVPPDLHALPSPPHHCFPPRDTPQPSQIPFQHERSL